MSASEAIAVKSDVLRELSRFEIEHSKKVTRNDHGHD